MNNHAPDTDTSARTGQTAPNPLSTWRILQQIRNLTADPELRFTPSGAAVANFTVASTPRNYDRTSGQWKDGEPLFLRCTIWNQAAENLAETLTRGTRVIVVGRLKQRSFETRSGDKRTVIELDVDEIGPSLRWATATVNKASRTTTAAEEPWSRAPYATGGDLVGATAGPAEPPY